MFSFSSLRPFLLLILLQAVQGQVRFRTAENFVATRYTDPNVVRLPRGILIDDVGDILIVSNKPFSRITAVYEATPNVVETAEIVNDVELGLNHGIAYNAGYLYASSATNVYRWPYTPGQRTALRSSPEIVVRNMPRGGHETRTLIFDGINTLYVSVGSANNVDANSDRARVRRFNVGQGIPPGGFDFPNGQVFADGLRNAVGLAFDSKGVLWGVDNGADNLNRKDLGGDIHNTNPADELIRFDQALGTFYGYPYCWTVDTLQNYASGDQLAWPEFMHDTYTDMWCNKTSMNRGPTLPLPAHHAPLGITFYDGRACSNNSVGAFPCDMIGDAFVAFHGSWNRKPPGGYRVARIPIDPITRLPTGKILDIIYEPSVGSCSPCLRPVSLAFDNRGRLLVTVDSSSEILRINYEDRSLDPDPTTTSEPTTSPTTPSVSSTQTPTRTPTQAPTPTPKPNSAGKLNFSGILFYNVLKSAVLHVKIDNVEHPDKIAVSLIKFYLHAPVLHTLIVSSGGQVSFKLGEITMARLANLICLLLAVSSRSFVNGQASFNTTGNYRASSYASVSSARGLFLDETGDLLVSSANSRLTSVYVVDGNVQTSVLLQNTDLRLNHGISYRNGFLYASSTVTTYRWPFTPGQRTAITESPEIVIKNQPPGGHATRTLVFDDEGLLYVSVGSNGNVDQDSSRARIRRFNISSIPVGGIEFTTGEVFADGLRNEVGLAFDGNGVLWGVQNGADNLNRDDLGGDIHNTNPADEMTKFDQAIGTHYGYPFCWTVDELANHQRGEQFAWPTFMTDGVHTDSWCNNVNNNRPPTLPLPAHNAALGITFYDGSVCNSSAGAFPCSMTGDAFVAFHGSWNREPPQGYKVVRIPIDPQTRLPTGEILDVMYEPDPAGCGRCLQPVNVVFNKEGHLLVSADASSEIFRITYAQ
ncbi:L-sorbosone dehydrogenase [Orchesella cincta]|uniref:L-sorbosone dehydrogenase n=1 Tax=Orchesella cincta TaxID=48709 RepID=A0A1D2NJQ4_ORCCI|nr:L-sorbosone dehydrogenase [Orchesella cincta]